MLFLAVMTEGVVLTEGHGAFEALFRDFYSAIVRFFSGRGLSPEDCQDLAQETFLRAYRSFDGFRGDAKGSTWLLTIAANVWKNRLRDAEAAKRAADEVPLAEDGPALPDSGKPPLEEAIDAERRQLLRAAIDALPPEMRRSVLLRVYQDMSYRDVADTLNVSVESVKSQVSRARLRLKSVLAEHYPDLESRLDERGR